MYCPDRGLSPDPELLVPDAAGDPPLEVEVDADADADALLDPLELWSPLAAADLVASEPAAAPDGVPPAVPPPVDDAPFVAPAPPVAPPPADRLAESLDVALSSDPGPRRKYHPAPRSRTTTTATAAPQR